MRIALLISGSGSTASTIIKTCRDGNLKNVEPVLVIASNSQAGGIKKTINAGMNEKDVAVISPKNFASAEELGQAIISECEKRNVDFIGQYGWLCLTPANVIKKYQNMMVNQHPGPLDVGRPDFGGQGMYGKRVHAARLCFVKKTGKDFWTEATCQRVAENFDEGAVLKSKRLDILAEDTVDDLAARLLPIEHKVQIETLSDFANGQEKEIKRDEPLVKPEEVVILEECKKQAIKQYPKG